MLHSAEVRWFHPHPPSEELLRWFLANRRLPPEDDRRDRYLWFPECDAVGVKQRESRLEVKARVSGPHPLALDPAPPPRPDGPPGDPREGRTALGSGRAERWVKWSLASAALPQLQDDLNASGRWLAVDKRRWLLKWEATTGGVVEAAAPDPGRAGDTENQEGNARRPRPDTGCNVELTAVSLVDAAPPAWTSLAFEAFGAPATLDATLRATLVAFFRDRGAPPGVRLDGRASLSYPAWLAAVA